MKLNQKGFGLVEGLLIIIAITLVGFTGFYVYKANEKDKSLENNISTQQTQPDNTQPTPNPVAEDLIDYGKDGVEIKQETDVKKLTGASESFKKYISEEILVLVEDAKQCDGEAGITVNKILNDEFARGGAGSCGGAAQIWKKNNNKWSVVLGFQDIPSCDEEIKREKIPNKIIDECLIEKPNGEYETIKNPN